MVQKVKQQQHSHTHNQAGTGIPDAQYLSNRRKLYALYATELLRQKPGQRRVTLPRWGRRTGPCGIHGDGSYGKPRSKDNQMVFYCCPTHSYGGGRNGGYFASS